jgi:aryl sulfotransferase
VAMPSVQTWYKLFLSDAFFFGSWAQNLQDYWALRHHPNVMVITFEQMKADHMGIVREVHDFLGLDLTEAEIQKVYEKSTFAYMKNIAHKFDPIPVTLFTGSDKAQMIRKGKSGGSSELFTVDQQRAIDDFCRAELQRIGSDFPYEEHFKLA